MMTPATLLLSPADSARAIASVYTVSLLATLPLVAAAIAATALRHASAEARALVWKSAIVALLVMFVGRNAPLHWMAWVIPSVLAAPLVVLGRMEVAASPAHSALVGGDAGGTTFTAVAVVGLLTVYVAGVATILIPTLVASMRTRRLIAGARRPGGPLWSAALAEACAAAGVSRRVGRSARVWISPRATVPMTWGALRPVVILPEGADAWDDRRRHMVLVHELTHVRSADWLCNLAARIACALLWFHPGVWLAARSLHDECELACDDRVIASGALRSDYAELLVHAADALIPAQLPRGTALALSRRHGLRARLAAILDTRHDVRPLARGWVAASAVVTLGIAAPMSVVQLAPTREVLTTLMLDSQWESRAYAVLGLAQRADSVAVARSAAEDDPSPRVRAWARYALGQRDPLPNVSLDNARDLRAVIGGR